MFLEGIEEIEGVHDNTPPLKQVEHVVVDEVVNDNELVKNAERISLKEKL